MNIATILSVALAATAAGFQGAAQATVLIFDQSRSATGTDVVPIVNGADVPQDYGDNVTGSSMVVPGGAFTYGSGGEGFTPNVTAEYFSDTNVVMWATGYGDLTNVLLAHTLPGGPTAANTLNVRLAAAPGYDVQLFGFDLAGYFVDYVINGVSVLSGAATLFSQADVSVEGNATGPGHTAFDFSAAPLSGPELLIRIDVANLAIGSQDNIGLDNIRFGQMPPAAVPLPATAWLFGSGCLGLLGVVRHRRS